MSSKSKSRSISKKTTKKTKKPKKSKKLKNYIPDPTPKFPLRKENDDTLVFDVEDVAPWLPHPRPVRTIKPKIRPVPILVITKSRSVSECSVISDLTCPHSLPKSRSVRFSSDTKLLSMEDFLPFGLASTYDTKEERESRTIRFRKSDGTEDYVVLALEDEPWLL